jgi:hypothetical protein
MHIAGAAIKPFAANEADRRVMRPEPLPPGDAR